MKGRLSLIFIVSIFLVVLGGCTEVDETQIQGLVYEDDLGRTVNYSPDKIVADYYIGELLYLDANVVGANLSYISEVWPEDKLATVEDTGDSLEKIASLEPTLIITLNQDMIEQYEVLAPTIYIEYGKDKPIELLRKFGVILNKEDQVEEVISQFENRITNIKKEIDNPNYTYTIVQEFEGVPTLYGSNWGRGGFILYDYLELNGTEAGENDYINNTDSYMNMNSESLLDYIGDVVIIFTDMTSSNYENNMITQNPLFEETDAYKNDNVYYIDEQYMYDDPYTVEYLLNYYEQILSDDKL